MRAATIAALRERARRRLPRFVFDYLDGGAGSEAGIRRNEAAFAGVTFRPRYLVGIEARSLATTLFGRRWAAPIGVAPIGLGNLVWPGTDEAVARAAVAAGIPCTIATAGTTTLERIRELAGEHAWYMLYPGRSPPVVADLVDRAEAAGYDVMLVTVDVPLQAIRPREIRNGFATPFRLAPRVLADLARHPAWSLATLRAGAPRFATMAKYADPGPAGTQAAYVGAQVSGRFDWAALEALRARWKRRLVIKGLLTAEDAVRARAIGCDGIVVSNHGGRQLDALPATLDVLPAIRAALGPDFPLLLDGGVRSGEDVVKALALGADFVLCGRAVMYGAAALGAAGPATAIRLLIDQADRCLGQIGYPDPAELKRAAPVARAGDAGTGSNRLI